MEATAHELSAQAKAWRPCKKCGATDRYSNGNCRPCLIARNRAKRAENPELYRARARASRNKHRVQRCADHKAWYEANKERINKQKKEQHTLHPEKRKARDQAYRLANRAKIRAARRVKYNTNPQWKLSMRLRGRLGDAIRNKSKVGSAVRDLGCNLSELKQYIESKFQPGMSWENWSLDGWHLDHVRPLATFDLTDRAQFLQAMHFTNLQPLWAEENMSKGAKREAV